MSGQTLTDRIAAAQYQLTGSDMARAVCKATTHEVMAPKKKHLECKCVPLACCMADTCHRGHLITARAAPSLIPWAHQGVVMNGCGQEDDPPLVDPRVSAPNKDEGDP